MKYPEAWQIEPLIARTYAGENKPDEAVKHLAGGATARSEQRRGQGADGLVLSQQGKTADVQSLLDGIDMTKVTDPVVFLNQGINLINQGKAAEALPIFEKVVPRFRPIPTATTTAAAAIWRWASSPRRKQTWQKFIAMPGADAGKWSRRKKILEQAEIASAFPVRARSASWACCTKGPPICTYFV